MNRNESSDARKDKSSGGGSGGERDRQSDAGKGRDIPRGTDEHAEPSEAGESKGRQKPGGEPPRT